MTTARARVRFTRDGSRSFPRYPDRFHSADARRRRPRVTGFLSVRYEICLKGVWHEGLRFLHQRERFVASLVRPLVAPQVQLESRIDA